MKKILIALALLASVQIAGAQQVKSVNAARAGVDKALKTVSDAKAAFEKKLKEDGLLG